MGGWQQFKLVVAAAAAVAVDLALFWFQPQVGEVPRWFNAVLAVLLYPTFVVVLYVMITALRHIIPIAFGDSGGTNMQQRLDGLANAEYGRRLEDFRRKHEPPQPWDKRPN